jgi:murein DD-endopeptidase MepM/ murein hydrolase activator NlpD
MVHSGLALRLPTSTAPLTRTGMAVLLAGTLLVATPASGAPPEVTVGRGAEGTTGVAPADQAVWPLDPRPEVLTGFDPPTSAWGAGHRGVDLAASVGQPVRAARGGTISYAGRLAGRGVVVVTHGATRTTYEPVSATVSVGERVATGARLGRVELFGSHCFPRACLHWGLLEGERYLDPLTLVGAGPIRLLPWQGLATSRKGSAAEPTWRTLDLGRLLPSGRGALFRG